MQNSIVMRIDPEIIEKISIFSVSKIKLKTKPKIDLPFRAYIYCPKAHKKVYDDSEGEHRLVYYADDLARVHEAFGGISIRNPYGSLGPNDRLLNGYVIGYVTVDRIKKIDQEYNLYFSDVHWCEEPLRLESVADSAPISWRYCKI